MGHVTHPALYDDDDGGVSNVMLGQGLWFDHGALEEGIIVGWYECDGWLPEVLTTSRDIFSFRTHVEMD